MELQCLNCNKTKDEKDFTKFERNKNLEDREGVVIYCRDCCNDMVERLGNDEIALKNVLKIVDIPYLESYVQTAIASYKRKKKSAKKQGKEEPQNMLYSLYMSKSGLFPKKYTCFAHSDGIRSEDFDKVVEEKDVSEKDIITIDKWMIKKFGVGIDNQIKLSQIINLEVQKLNLDKNDVNKRQRKHIIKQKVSYLIERGKLDNDLFTFLFEDDREKKVKSKDIMEVKVEKKKEIPIDTNKYDMGMLRVKWGREYRDEDLIRFEDKYQFLKGSFENNPSPSHEEYLKLASISNVKANKCMSENDIDGAKTYTKMFDDLCGSGKLQPKQLNEDGKGLSSFGEYWKAVEQVANVIDIMPEFLLAPRDKADVIIWCNVNYMRRLFDMEDASYKDVYKFYEEFESQFVDQDDEDDIDTSLFSSSGSDEDE